MPENTGPKQDTRFKPGQSGNPAGKPKGAKHKLQEDFTRDVLTAWEARGPEAINSMIAEKPTEFVKMVAGLMPKDFSLKVNDFADLTDDQLARQLAAIAAQLASAGFGIGEGIGQAPSSEQPGELPTLQ